MNVFELEDLFNVIFLLVGCNSLKSDCSGHRTHLMLLNGF